MSSAEIARQFGAIAKAATARLTDRSAAAETRVATAHLAKMMAAASAGSRTT
jgi:hypothetical protein